MRFDVFTLFPGLIRPYLEESILQRARERGLLEVAVHDIRAWTEDRHHVTDEPPYGGGGGMIMKVEPIFAAVESVLGSPPACPVILLTPQGRTFTQRVAEELVQQPHLALLCGRYEGVDERVRQHLVTDEISIGDFVLTGGELPALTLIDAISRLIPGVLGDPEGAADDSHATGLLEYPHYTRPPVYRGWEIPAVLLSGNHAAVARWRREQSLLRTLLRRKDMLERASLTPKDLAFLEKARRGDIPAEHRLETLDKRMQTSLVDIIPHFKFEGSLVEAVQSSAGHIHETTALSFRQHDGSTRRYILQRINHHVFRDPPALMENITRVTAHLREKIVAAGGDPERETLTLAPTRAGGVFHQDESGFYWRAYHFIEGACSYETAQSDAHVFQSARAFGIFQRHLSDFSPGQLHESIPNFHFTPGRFAAFEDAVRRDTAGRADQIREEITFLEQRQADTTQLVDGLANGTLPLRVTHNDAKLNNVMIDEKSGEGICVVDLDTVMPGTALYDFGDMVRSAAARCAEDEPDSRLAGVSLHTFETLASGYLDAVRGFLTDPEIDLLAFSARVITLEQALRFLADYLNGDTYYKIHRPGQNLDRARTQIEMLRDMETNFEKMQRIIDRHR